MAKLTKKDKIEVVLISIAATLLMIGMLAGCALTAHFNYRDTFKHTPDINWVEEDLEPVFMTTGVCVLNADDEGSHIYYTVSANGFYYKVHYGIKGGFFLTYHWSYINHIQIKEEEAL